MASSAEEVFVDLVGVILGFGEDEAVFASDVVAPAAAQHAAGEVVVDSVALSPFHAALDDLLDTVEQFRCDECFVPARVDVSFEGDHTEVVRFTQDEAELAPGEWTLGPLAGLAGCESLLGEQSCELGCAVLASDVLPERPADERCALSGDFLCPATLTSVHHELTGYRAKRALTLAGLE